VLERRSKVSLALVHKVRAWSRIFTIKACEREKSGVALW